MTLGRQLGPPRSSSTFAVRRGKRSLVTSLRIRLPHVLAAVALLAGCRAGGPSTAGEAGREPTDLPTRARSLAQRVLIADGHIDLPHRLLAEREALGAIRSWDFATGTSTVRDFDYERARAGGLNAPFMSIYVPSEHQKTPGKSKAVADELIDLVEEIVRGAPSRFAIARSPRDLAAHQADGKVSLPMGIENASAFEDNLALVAHFHARGVRYATLTHSKDNEICDSSYDETATWKGLSPFGREVIGAMNRVGMMIDVRPISRSSLPGTCSECGVRSRPSLARTPRSEAQRPMPKMVARVALKRMPTE